ncbi:MAG: hypothetical protein HY720_27985 [Planctomycetes bacterium]|nr:hypothetical protein [Planctomycetota bacterium]
MSVRIEVSCPSCGTVYKLRATAEGNLLKCKKCKTVIDLSKTAPERGTRRGGTGRRAKSGTGRHGAVGSEERTGRRPRKNKDVMVWCAIGGVFLFVAVVVVLLVATSGGEDQTKKPDTSKADNDKKSSYTPPPAGDGSSSDDNPFAEHPPSGDGKRPDSGKPDGGGDRQPSGDGGGEPSGGDGGRDLPDSPGGEPAGNGGGLAEQPAGPPSGDFSRGKGVRSNLTADRVGETDRERVASRLQDIHGGDPVSQDRARDDLRLMGKHILPLILNDFAKVNLSSGDEWQVGIYLVQILKAYNNDNDFGFHDATWGDTPNYSRLQSLRQKWFDWYDAGANPVGGPEGGGENRRGEDEPGG